MGNGRFVPGQKPTAGGWKEQGFERFIKDFALMASKGLFSFDTDPLFRTQKGRYYLVAIPERTLLASELPQDIGKLLSRVRAPLRFTECNYIQESTTAGW